MGILDDGVLEIEHGKPDAGLALLRSKAGRQLLERGYSGVSGIVPADNDEARTVAHTLS